MTTEHEQTVAERLTEIARSVPSIPGITAPELVGGPVDTFTADSTTNGITLWQRDAEGSRVHLTPDDAYGLLHTLLSELRTYSFPEMIVGEDQFGDVTMTCPRCGNESGTVADAAVDIIDFDIRRTGGFVEGTAASPELHVHYDSETNYELLVVECSGCNDPVSLPKNVVEIN